MGVSLFSAAMRLLLLLGFLLPVAVHAQPLARPDSAFAMLLGTWSGEARPRTARGEMRIFQTESVRAAVGGNALIIEGRGYRLTDGGVPEPMPAFQAFGMLVRTPDGYRMHSVTNEGRSTTAVVEPQPGGFDWWFDVPGGGRVRYEIRVRADGAWHETGTYAPPGGAQAFPNFEMTVWPSVR